VMQMDSTQAIIYGISMTKLLLSLQEIQKIH
jgi:hypothetical protein